MNTLKDQLRKLYIEEEGSSFEKLDFKKREKKKKVEKIPEVDTKSEIKTPAFTASVAEIFDDYAKDFVVAYRQELGLKPVGFPSVFSTDDFKDTTLDDKGRVAFPRPIIRDYSKVPGLKLGQLLTHCASDDRDRDLPPGAYVIVGAPAAGKSLLMSHFHNQLKDYAVTPLLIKEPVNQELRAKGIRPANDWADISELLGLAFTDESDIITIDSFRFLEAISRYPAKSGGVMGGLGLYATDFDAYAADCGKRLFVIFTLGNDDARTKEEVVKTLVGATAGVFYPYPPSEGRTETGLSGWYSLRYGDRARKEFQVDVGFEVTGSRKVKTLKETEQSRVAEDIDNLTERT